MKKNSSGMTLIEVLISLAILTFLSISTGRFIRNSLKDKAKKTREAEGQSQVRDALNVMKRDINLAFNYHDINVYVYNRAEKVKRSLQQQEQQQNNSDAPKTGQTQPDQGQATAPGGAPNPSEFANSGQTQSEFVPKKEKRLTHFMGTSEDLHFTTRISQPRRPNEKVSDIMEVGYYIETCHPKGRPQAESSDCLWRRQSKIIDEDVREGGSSTVLVENVKEFNLSYKGPERETEWIKEWKTKETINDYQKDVFPYMVRVELVTTHKQKDYDLTLVTSIHNPLNIKEQLETKFNENPQQGQQQPPGGPSAPGR
ncbi:MAG: type II secretion system GspH family protein [Bdellovibrionales bacterium]|nr:type II secretion system GspH family protein [Bdellovibrionales bacterium]